jgi:hypothetical protein
MITIILEELALPTFTSALKMETSGYSETLVNTYRTIWHHNPEDHNHSNFILVIPEFGTDKIIPDAYIYSEMPSQLCETASRRAYTVSSAESTFKASSSLSSPNQLYQDP